MPQEPFRPNPVTVNTSSSSSSSAAGSFIWELVKIVVLALVIILPLRILVAEPFIVSGSSMIPTFHDKEYLIIDKLSYRFSEPQRGDVIVFKYPKDTSQFFIKRIIGLPGDTVKVESGRVVVFNSTHPEGQRLEESYLPNQAVTYGSSEAVRLGSDEYYVLGDNRVASSDSRIWGILPRQDFVGKAWFRVFPVSDLGLIQHPDYAF
jgi:signal peptidase I